MVKFTRATVTVAHLPKHGAPIEQRTVDAYLPAVENPRYAVHRVIGNAPTAHSAQWVVTHLPSGVQVRACGSLAGAKPYAVALNDVPTPRLDAREFGQHSIDPLPDADRAELVAMMEVMRDVTSRILSGGEAI